MKYEIPKEISNAVNALENKGFSAYLVGGCVRDLILNREPKDWDLTTDADPNEIMSIFPEHVYENNFGTVGIKTESEDPRLKIIEVTPYRLESTYTDNRHPDSVKYSKKIEEDLMRRDFTINSIALDINKNIIIDPYKGQKDIKDKIIQTVGDPDQRFKEDALRILRAVRFSAELGFMISSETMQSLIKNANLLANVSRERIRDEFTKIILSENPMIGLDLTKKMGIISYISTNFESMFDVKQNKQAHKYDVWEHSLRTLQHAADKGYSLEIRLAALFHDIGKPPSKREEQGKTTFYGHEVISSKVTRETLESLNFSKTIIEKVVKLVRWHMFFSDTEEITHTAIRRLIARVGEDNIWDLINLRKCDRIGTGRPKEEPYRFRKFQSMIDEVLRDPISVNMLKIDGNTMINMLHMKPGPQIGYILSILLEEVIQDPAKNELDHQIARTKELMNIDIDKLKEMSDIARELRDDTEDQELSKLRDNRFVK